MYRLITLTIIFRVANHSKYFRVHLGSRRLFNGILQSLLLVLLTRHLLPHVLQERFSYLFGLSSAQSGFQYTSNPIATACLSQMARPARERNVVFRSNAPSGFAITRLFLTRRSVVWPLCFSAIAISNDRLAALEVRNHFSECTTRCTLSTSFFREPRKADNPVRTCVPE